MTFAALIGQHNRAHRCSEVTLSQSLAIWNTQFSCWWRHHRNPLLAWDRAGMADRCTVSPRRGTTVSGARTQRAESSPAVGGPGREPLSPAQDAFVRRSSREHKDTNAAVGGVGTLRAEGASEQGDRRPGQGHGSLGTTPPRPAAPSRGESLPGRPSGARRARTTASWQCRRGGRLVPHRRPDSHPTRPGLSAAAGPSKDGPRTSTPAVTQSNVAELNRLAREVMAERAASRAPRCTTWR